MFLKKIKVKQFAEREKYWDTKIKEHARRVRKINNINPDEVFYIIGQSFINEGVNRYIGYEEGFTFDVKARHRVFIVANKISRKFLVLPEDIEEV